MLKKFILLIYIASIALAAQSSEEINKIFKQGIDEFKNENWSSALKMFNQIANEYGSNPKTSLALLFSGKSYLKLNEYSEAEKTLLRLLQEYSNSKYLDEANFTLSLTYLEEKKYFQSFWRLCLAVNNSTDDLNKNTAKNSAVDIALNYLSAEQVKAVYDTTKFSSVKSFLLLIAGKLYLSQNNRNLAKETLTKIMRSFPDSKEKKEAQRLFDEVNQIKESTRQPDIIGVILSLSKSLSISKASSEILEGIKFSLSEFNEGRENKIGILVRDTESDRTKLSQINEEFSEVENLKCIVGPILSVEVKDALDIFENVSVPIISPTATDDYLTDANPNFFQANPSFITRGRLMAQYVYFTENKRRILILNAIDGYSPILSSSFSQEFERLGGRIVIHEAYRSGSIDIKEQIKKISEGINQADGLYIPLADRSDIPILISSLSQLNLSIPVYGDQDWMSPTDLESASFLDNNLIFCSDYFIKFDEQEYQKFTKDFLAKTKMNVNRNVLYGYDAMKFILTCIRSTGMGTNSLKQKMISGITVAGFKNNTCFDSSRINRYLNIIGYSKGKFELINKFKISN